MGTVDSNKGCVGGSTSARAPALGRQTLRANVAVERLRIRILNAPKEMKRQRIVRDFTGFVADVEVGPQRCIAFRALDSVNRTARERAILIATIPPSSVLSVLGINRCPAPWTHVWRTRNRFGRWRVLPQPLGDLILTDIALPCHHSAVDSHSGETWPRKDSIRFWGRCKRGWRLSAQRRRDGGHRKNRTNSPAGGRMRRRAIVQPRSVYVAGGIL